MKKYTTPEVEITRFNTEDIMTQSGFYSTADMSAAKEGYSRVEDTVNYSQMFSIN